jgi:hypothetical protein
LDEIILIDQFSIKLVETVPIPTYVGVLGVLGFGSDPWCILCYLGWEPIRRQTATMVSRKSSKQSGGFGRYTAPSTGGFISEELIN